MIKFAGKFMAKNIIKSRSTLVISLNIAIITFTSVPALALDGISRGQNIFLERGLQLQALSYICQNPSSIPFNPTRWEESNFTTIDIWDPFGYPVDLMQQSAPGIPWSTDNKYRGGDLYPVDLPYASSLVQVKFDDEQDITDPTYLQFLQSSMQSMNEKYPHVLTATNQYGGAHEIYEILNYMQFAKPDMLQFDTYPFDGQPRYSARTSRVGDLQCYYRDLASYRICAMAGNDGTGAKPIPFGVYTQTYILDGHMVSESENRFGSFSAWAFGAKMTEAFYYDRYIDESVSPLLFTVPGTDNPTPQFYMQAETNRQSLNIGPALVRLQTTDVRMKNGANSC